MNESTVASTTNSKENKKKKHKKKKKPLSNKKSSSLLSDAYLPPTPELLPDMTQPLAYEYRDRAGPKFVEFRMRGRALCTQEYRNELPPLLHSLLKRDGSEADDSGSTVEPELPPSSSSNKKRSKSRGSSKK
mmetsp:Transcript_16898/g.19905  ORF Transcript_16898/g.19905 Transcript_16898/m.19905 type:complete len:132 (-) Transcript_16898:23-418(-)